MCGGREGGREYTYRAHAPANASLYHHDMYMLVCVNVHRAIDG